MALANVLDAIRREAEEEAARLLADARLRARGIEEEAQARVAAEREEMAATAGREGTVLRRRKVQEARLVAQREKRAAQEAVFQQAREHVRTALDEARGKENYAGVFGALLAEARAALPEAVVERVDPRDRELLESAEPTLESLGGVELRAADGRIVRNTLEERLRRAEPELRRLAAHAMELR